MSTAGLFAHGLFSQVELHRAYGGVVPELASRDHVKKLLPLIERVLEEAASGAHDINGIAYTAGPGLIGALLTGAALARSLAFAWQVPALGVHHLEGHLLAPLLEPEPPPFPHVALLVSGGHTLLIEVSGIGAYRVLGASRDDAAGEAFDKTAKLLGLPYPGGPQLAELAEHGRARALQISPADARSPGTGVQLLGTEDRRAARGAGAGAHPAAAYDIARAVEDAIVDTLIGKSLRALEASGLQTLVVSGGVSANRALRARLTAAAGAQGARVYYPRIEFSTDNAAMIAVAGLARLKAGEHDSLAIGARAQWPLESLRRWRRLPQYFPQGHKYS